jgi:hypothetical protein
LRVRTQEIELEVQSRRLNKSQEELQDGADHGIHDPAEPAGHGGLGR